MKKELWEQLRIALEELKKVLHNIFISPDVDEDVIFQPPRPKTVLLNGMAMAIEKYEDYVIPGGRYRDGRLAPEGSLTFRCKNPGACRFYPGGYLSKYGVVKEYKEGLNLKPGQRGFAQFETKEIGTLYCKNLILEKAKRHPDWNLERFFSDEKDGWAPTSDSNYPLKYARFVASQMDVSSTTWKIGDLI